MNGSITRRGKGKGKNGSWRLKWELGRCPKTGKRITRYKTVRGTKADAEAELQDILSQLRNGGYVDPHKLTVRAVLTKWADEVARHKVSAKTFERYQDHLDRVASTLGDTPLLQLQPLQIHEFYNQLRAKGNKRSGFGLEEQTLLHIHRVVVSALDQAVRWRLLSANPALAVEAPRPRQREQRTLRRDPAQGIDEIDILLTTAKDTPLFVPVLVLLTSGIRRGELLALKWQDVNWSAGSLNIVRSLEETQSHGLRFKSTKTGAGRRLIPLPSVTFRQLRLHRTEQERRLSAGSCDEDHDLIFPGASGGPQRPRNFSKSFARLIKRSGLATMGVHGLRHTHVTELLRAGVNPKVVSERAGHVSVAFTLQRYAHALPDMQEAAAAEMQALVGGLVEG